MGQVSSQYCCNDYDNQKGRQNQTEILYTGGRHPKTQSLESSPDYKGQENLYYHDQNFNVHINKLQSSRKKGDEELQNQEQTSLIQNLKKYDQNMRNSIKFQSSYQKQYNENEEIDDEFEQQFDVAQKYYVQDKFINHQSQPIDIFFDFMKQKDQQLQIVDQESLNQRINDKLVTKYMTQQKIKKLLEVAANNQKFQRSQSLKDLKHLSLSQLFDEKQLLQRQQNTARIQSQYQKLSYVNEYQNIEQTNTTNPQQQTQKVLYTLPKISLDTISKNSEQKVPYSQQHDNQLQNKFSLKQISKEDKSSPPVKKLNWIQKGNLKSSPPLKLTKTNKILESKTSPKQTQQNKRIYSARQEKSQIIQKTPSKLKSLKQINNEIKQKLESLKAIEKKMKKDSIINSNYSIDNMKTRVSGKPTSARKTNYFHKANVNAFQDDYESSSRNPFAKQGSNLYFQKISELDEIKYNRSSTKLATKKSMVQNFEGQSEKLEKNPNSLIEKAKEQYRFNSYGLLRFKQVNQPQTSFKQQRPQSKIEENVKPQIKYKSFVQLMFTPQKAKKTVLSKSEKKKSNNKSVKNQNSIVKSQNFMKAQTNKVNENLNENQKINEIQIKLQLKEQQGNEVSQENNLSNQKQIKKDQNQSNQTNYQIKQNTNQKIKSPISNKSIKSKINTKVKQKKETPQVVNLDLLELRTLDKNSQIKDFEKLNQILEQEEIHSKKSEEEKKGQIIESRNEILIQNNINIIGFKTGNTSDYSSIIGVKVYGPEGLIQQSNASKFGSQFGGSLHKYGSGMRKTLKSQAQTVNNDQVHMVDDFSSYDAEFQKKFGENLKSANQQSSSNITFSQKYKNVQIIDDQDSISNSIINSINKNQEQSFKFRNSQGFITLRRVEEESIHTEITKLKKYYPKQKSVFISNQNRSISHIKKSQNTLNDLKSLKLNSENQNLIINNQRSKSVQNMKSPKAEYQQNLDSKDQEQPEINNLEDDLAIKNIEVQSDSQTKENLIEKQDYSKDSEGLQINQNNIIDCKSESSQEIRNRNSNSQKSLTSFKFVEVNNDSDLKIKQPLMQNKSDYKILRKNNFMNDLIGSISEQEESSPSKISVMIKIDKSFNKDIMQIEQL